jgi:uncharacterized protein YkvS
MSIPLCLDSISNEKKCKNLSSGDTNNNFFTGAYGYIVSRKGLKKLVNNLNKASYHVDISMSNLESLNIKKGPMVVEHTNFEKSNNSSYNNSDKYLRKLKVMGMPLDWVLSMPILQIRSTKITGKGIIILLLIVIILMIVCSFY